jgi:NAD(P)-dependent dehydrogenase (short-subunit alcohol dehydrogenase family)
MIDTSFKDLNDKVCAITGGNGVIGSCISEALSAHGVKLAILGMENESDVSTARDISKRTGTQAIYIKTDVLDKKSLSVSKKIVNEKLGRIDILVNCAGGNSPKATTGIEMLLDADDDSLAESFFGLDDEAIKRVADLNFLGTLLPTMVFGPDMAKKKKGVVLNISSMNAFRPLTRIPAYSAAKASINNFTQWLAVHLSRVNVRVNAIAPGFLLTNQNRFLLINEDDESEISERGKKIIDHTPMGRFGTPEELCGAVLFFVSQASSFITGVVLPIDGGFSAYAGV